MTKDDALIGYRYLVERLEGEYRLRIEAAKAAFAEERAAAWREFVAQRDKALRELARQRHAQSLAGSSLRSSRSGNLEDEGGEFR